MQRLAANLMDDAAEAKANAQWGNYPIWLYLMNFRWMENLSFIFPNTLVRFSDYKLLVHIFI